MSRRLIHYMAVAVIVATVGSTGCGTKLWPFGKKKTTVDGGAGAETSVPPFGGTDITSGTRPPWSGVGERGLFPAIYFDFDSARIRPNEVSRLEQVASYLKANRGKNLVIEGHADERGTAEYNRALGERRALAARDELVRMGIEVDRLFTISYGKEKPADMGHDEGAWAKNRRCEFVVMGQ